MQYTDVFSFRKPQYGEPADVQDINWNADQIDLQLYKNRRVSAEKYDPAETYSTGDLRIAPDGLLYKCTGENVTGEWNATYWELTDLASEVGQGGGGSAEVTKTAEGNPITFTDGANAPMPEVVAEISAKQDLHGYSKPWVGGAGKNKCPKRTSSTTFQGVTITPNDDGSINLKSTNASECSIRCHETQKINLSAGTYIASIGGAGSYSMQVTVNDVDVQNSFTVTATDNVGLLIKIPSGASFDITIYPMIRLATVSDATWEPYSNICPISGMDEVNVGVSGFNQWDEEWETGTLNPQGETQDNNVDLRSKNFCKVDSGATYCYSIVTTITGMTRYVFWYDADKNFISYHMFTAQTTVAPNNAKYFKLVAQSYIRLRTTYENNICFNISNTSRDGTYEPYKGATYTIDLNGTRYGGTLDVRRGVLTATWGYIASYAGETLPGEWISDRDEYAPNTSPTTGAEVAYALATPQEIPLTAEQIKSLLGNNTITTNADSLSVEYITKDYQPLVDLIEEGAYEEVILWSGFARPLSSEKQLSASIDEFDALVLYGAGYMDDNMFTLNIPLFVLTSQIEYGTSSQIEKGYTSNSSHGGAIRRATMIFTDSTHFVVTVAENSDDTYCGFSKVVGLKLGRGGSGSGGGSSSHNYSTTEQEVGTWIDGSTVYEKTYHTESYIEFNGQANISSAIPNWTEMDMIVSGVAYRKDSGNIGAFYSPLIVFKDITNSRLIGQIQYSGGVGLDYITIRYTKVTS